jgi:hypothetical protein
MIAAQHVIHQECTDVLAATLPEYYTMVNVLVKPNSVKAKHFLTYFFLA